MTTHITASIPYVNAAPHLGHAYELVQADIAVRARRARDEQVRFTTGTDDNSLKNVHAASRTGQDVARFVDAHADTFIQLHRHLSVDVDDVVRTSTDPRHRRAVDRIWRAAADAGHLYRKPWGGHYCVGCEVHLRESELDAAGHCPDHHTPPEWIEEDNWFFRLSEHQDHLLDLITSGTLRIAPEPFAREVLSFIEAGLDDISVSRSSERAQGWGIPVPDDPDQVIYVWFDALANYLSALDWGSPEPDSVWSAQANRIHVIGKGILRFHAVHWPAFLAAAGEPPPTEIRVHPYLTVDGAKISKSGQLGLNPVAAIDAVSADGLRWYFARDINDVADTDVTLERIVARVNDELANGLGNAVNRLATLAHKHLAAGGLLDVAPTHGVEQRCRRATGQLAAFEHREAARNLARAIAGLNADINETRPWELARNPADHGELATALSALIADARCIATAIEPICPTFAARVHTQLSGPNVPPPEPTFRRIERK